MSEPATLPPAPPTRSLAAEVTERLRTGKVACMLVIFLMPLGSTLDAFVYLDHWRFFLVLRLICSGLAALLLALHFKNWEAQHYRLLGQPVHRLLALPIALLPAFFIAWMIYVTEGVRSPYYASLSLIVLAMNVMVR